MTMILDQLWALQFELVTMPGEWHDHWEGETTEAEGVKEVARLNRDWTLNGQRRWRLVRTTTEVVG